MSYDYYYRLEKAIDLALQQNKFTFQEIIKECKGAYPREVLKILKSKKYSSQKEAIITFNKWDIANKKGFITEKIENNPILCSWYFSISTCKKIVDLYLWDNKKILFLGMPRLFEYFVRNVENAHFTLIDLDYYVVNKLMEDCKQRGDDSYKIIHADINNMSFELDEEYDAVFFDPPWYMEYYERWILQSNKVLKQKEGVLIFPLFQELTRPTAEAQRKILLNKIRERAEENVLISDFVEYDIPTFEKYELYNCGIELEQPWKKADLVIAKGINEYKYLISDDITNLRKWEEIDILNIRVFIDINVNDECEKVEIRYGSENGSYLNSPSKRNQELQLVNMLTSRGQGYIVKCADKLLVILKVLKEELEKGIDLREILCSIDMDDVSKKILYDMLGEKIC